MNYFDTTIDKDIDFLLKEVGQDVKINNVPARAIINNIDDKSNINDDKIIITDAEINIKRGMYINYDNNWFIVISQINDKRYNTYKKAIIRRCDQDVKIIIDNKLYQFPTFFESADLGIKDWNLIMVRGDFIKVVLPATSTTRKIKTQQRIVKFDNSYEVWGINEAKKDLITITMMYVIRDKNIDDYDNEIGGRWKNGEDKLNGNITPILPFDDEGDVTQKRIVAIYVADQEKEEMIKDVIIELESSKGEITTIYANETHEVNADIYKYIIEKEGYATVEGEIDAREEDINKIIYLEQVEPEPEEPEQDYYIEIVDGYDRIFIDWDETYTAQVYDNNGNEVDKEVRFELYTKHSKLVSQGNNKCTVHSGVITETMILKVILVEDESIFLDFKIEVVGL